MPTSLLPTLTATPLLAVGLTLAAYLVGSALFTRLGKPSWLPAILIAALLLAATLALLGLPYATYQQGATWLTVLLGPATVALGMPLYQQLARILACLSLPLWPLVTLLALLGFSARVRRSWPRSRPNR